jgi:hypothetical protein
MGSAHTVWLLGCWLVLYSLRKRQKRRFLVAEVSSGEEATVEGEVVGKAAVGRCLFFLAVLRIDSTVVEVIVASPEMPKLRVRQLKNDIKIGDRLSCIGVVCDSASRKPKTPAAVYALQCSFIRMVALCVRDNTGITRMVSPEDESITTRHLSASTNRDDTPEDSNASHGDKRLKSARAEIFASFLHDKFGDALQGGVLDVAGGRGELALELVLTDVPAIVVDPRLSSGLLSKNLRKRLRNSGRPPLTAWNIFFPPTPTDATHMEFLATATVVAGLHPDEATEAIVDYAIAHNKGFAVIPCCVFARLFSARRLVSKSGDVSHQVRTYEELLHYLSRKHPAIQSAQLNFEGKNTVLWAKAGDLADKSSAMCAPCT